MTTRKVPGTLGLAAMWPGSVGSPGRVVVLKGGPNAPKGDDPLRTVRVLAVRELTTMQGGRERRKLGWALLGSVPSAAMEATDGLAGTR
jgi:hypothetical protein